MEHMKRIVNGHVQFYSAWNFNPRKRIIGYECPWNAPFIYGSSDSSPTEIHKSESIDNNVNNSVPSNNNNDV